MGARGKRPKGGNFRNSEIALFWFAVAFFKIREDITKPSNRNLYTAQTGTWAVAFACFTLYIGDCNLNILFLHLDALRVQTVNTLPPPPLCCPRVSLLSSTPERAFMVKFHREQVPLHAYFPFIYRKQRTSLLANTIQKPKRTAEKPTTNERCQFPNESEILSLRDEYVRISLGVGSRGRARNATWLCLGGTSTLWTPQTFLGNLRWHPPTVTPTTLLHSKKEPTLLPSASPSVCPWQGKLVRIQSAATPILPKGPATNKAKGPKKKWYYRANCANHTR